MIEDLIYARDHAIQKDVWVVAVVPVEALDEALTKLAAVANGHPFGGRTVKFQRGKLSVVPVIDSVFLAPGKFQVMFLGWARKDQSMTGVERWRHAAARTLTRAA